MLYIYILLSIYILYVIYTLRHVLFHVSYPSRALSWILLIIFVPFIGVLLFRILGRSIKRDKYFQHKKTFYNDPAIEIKTELLPESKLPMIRMLNSNHSAALSYNNKAEIIKNGEKSFERVRQDIIKAKHFIHLDFYIIEQGNLLDSYIKLFEKKIKEGVVIRLVYDAFGTVDEFKSSFRKLKEIGVEIKEFMPFNWFKAYLYLNYRNHRKLIIIDNKVAYTGGMNISDKHVVGDPKLGLWRDTYVRVQGDAVLDFERVFNTDWNHAGGKRYTYDYEVPEHPGNTPVQVVTSGPDSDHRGIMMEYFSLITNAQKYVYISTPYFIPSEAILTALKTSALSGVDVRLVIPYNSDSKWMRWCMFTYFEDLLISNVRIYLYHSGFLHNKTIISDDVVASNGTANVDIRSFETNFEINAIIYDEESALKLKKHFNEDLLESEELHLEDFLYRPDRNKIMESIARLTSPLL